MMSTYYVFDKLPRLSGRTALGIEFNLQGIASALTLYWLRPQLNEHGAVISGGKYLMRVATAARTIAFLQLNLHDPMVFKNAFPASKTEPDLSVVVSGSAEGIELTPENFDNGKLKISLIAGKT